MASNQQDMYRTSLSLIKTIGEDFHFTSKRLLLFRVLNCTALVFLYSLVFANVFHVKSGMYVKVTESNIIVVHVLLKYIALIYYKDDLKQILVLKEKFWNYQSFDLAIVEKYNRFYKLAKILQMIIIIGEYVCIILILLRPLFYNDMVYFIEVFVFENSLFINSLTCLLEYYMCYLILSTVLGYDTLYLSFCVDLIIQVKLLKYKLRNLVRCVPSELKMELTECIEHHQLLLQFFERTNRIYSVVLFFQYFVTLIHSCLQLYEFIITKSSISYTIIKFFFICISFGEFTFYTFPAEEVAFQFSDICNHIYNSEWYALHIIVQKQLVVIMAQSQRYQYLSGIGLIDINIETFGSIVRKSLSFYTLLRNVLNIE